MKKFIKIKGENFQWKWLTVWGFYRVIWFGIVAYFGYTTVNQKPVNGIYISYGTEIPLFDLEYQGYSAENIGHIFNQPILEYKK